MCCGAGQGGWGAGRVWGYRQEPVQLSTLILEGTRVLGVAQSGGDAAPCCPSLPPAKPAIITVALLLAKRVIKSPSIHVYWWYRLGPACQGAACCSRWICAAGDCPVQHCAGPAVGVMPVLGMGSPGGPSSSLPPAWGITAVAEGGR